MLKKQRRLSAAEVREVIAHGRSSRSSLLSAKQSQDEGPARFAVVVSKKVAKKAVTRNRLRRAVYRALISFESRGNTVLFVHKIPTEPLTDAFRKELMVLLKHN